MREEAVGAARFGAGAFAGVACLLACLLLLLSLSLSRARACLVLATSLDSGLPGVDMAGSRPTLSCSSEQR